MTACVNKKSKRVAAVVTASLVGALSIGAPAVALADTTVDMLVAPEENAFSRGEVTLSGATYNPNAKVWEVKANKDGSALDIKATKFAPIGEGASDVEVKADDFKVSFAKADGTAVDSIVEPGQYAVTVECLKGQYAGGKATGQGCRPQGRFRIRGQLRRPVQHLGRQLHLHGQEAQRRVRRQGRQRARRGRGLHHQGPEGGHRQRRRRPFRRRSRERQLRRLHDRYRTVRRPDRRGPLHG